mmetsp:Transcript_23258/g.34453  ORF Transcript_23258/g.34453 Transcript_23258/m.34453 type:complete len:532 (+) Transcript_23258:312-1907(+)
MTLQLSIQAISSHHQRTNHVHANTHVDVHVPRKMMQKRIYNGLRNRTLSRIQTKTNMKLHSNSSPYLGYLRHAPMTAPKKSRMHLWRQSSPYVGFIRHAPPTSPLLHHGIGIGTGSGNGSENGNRSTTRKATKKTDVWEGFLKKHKCSGRLPGGVDEIKGSKHPNANALMENNYTSYSICRWFEASPSSGLFQLDVSESANKRIPDAYQYCPNFDTLEMLNKLAYWFLFPIAHDNDASYPCKDLGEMDYLNGFASFFSSLMRKVFQSNFSQSLGTTFEEGIEIEAGQTSEHQCMNTQLEQNSNLYQSISSIDSEEVRSSSTGGTQRHLDIESILRLPTMTYEEESSHGVVSSINTYDTDGGKSIKVGEEEVHHVPVGPERSGKALEWSWITVPKDPSHSMEFIESLVEPNLDHHHHFKDENCVICLDKFQCGDRLRILPCHHRFHTSCIDKWLSGSFSHDDCMNALCPTCKSDPAVQVPDEAHFAQGQSIGSIVSDGSLVDMCDDDSMQSMNLDGSLPSWSFALLGSKIAE